MISCKHDDILTSFGLWNIPTPSSCHSEERSDVGISGDGNHNRVWVPHPIVIPSMSSAETCLQGFPNDDLFGVIAFSLVQIKAVGLRYKRTITVERSVVGIQRSESSACVRSTLHQASDIAKLWLEFLSARVRSTLHQTIGRAKLR